MIKNNGHKYLYMRSVDLNDEPWNATCIATETLQKGSDMTYEMGPEPNKNWGVSEASIPYSPSNEK